MTVEEKRKIAVGYLVTHKDEIPEASAHLFDKLEKYDTSASNTFKAIQEARKSIADLNSQMQTITGSIGAIVDLIGETIPEDKVNEWSAKFDPQMAQSIMQDKPKAPNISVVGTATPKIIS
jgi:vacuolar-type H+-ATPase subunit I/STV1